MPRIRIQLDGRTVEAEAGMTILQAAEQAGIEIPSLCYRRGLEPCTSCYVCVVGIAGRNGLSPSCATKAEEGMVVDCSSSDVHAARQTALELLLSDHVGDCVGPCELACPAGLDIPAMLRWLQQGNADQARRLVMQDLAFARTLGAFCQGFCEKACRRSRHDAPLAIRRLHQAMTNDDRNKNQDTCEAASGCQKRDRGAVVVIGFSAVAVSAAYYLALDGYRVKLLTTGRPLAAEVLAAHPQAGQQLQADLAELAKLGVDLNEAPDSQIELRAIRSTCDALIVADETLASRVTPEDEANGIFRADRSPKYLVQAVGLGRSLAARADGFLAATAAPRKHFNIHMGNLQEGELERFLEQCPDHGKLARLPESGAEALSPAELTQEAGRCLHCDCRDKHECRLRLFSAQYQASPHHFGAPRRHFEQKADDQIVYESGKCIACGLCVQVSTRSGCRPGLAFIGRGFGMRVEVPGGGSVSSALGDAAAECIKACPTGALARRKDGF
jgi:ferredoxin